MRVGVAGCWLVCVFENQCEGALCVCASVNHVFNVSQAERFGRT